MSFMLTVEMMLHMPDPQERVHHPFVTRSPGLHIVIDHFTIIDSAHRHLYNGYTVFMVNQW